MPPLQGRGTAGRLTQGQWWRGHRFGGDESLDEGCFAPAGATFFRSAAKEGKDAPGEPFHKGSPGPLLTAKGAPPPLDPPLLDERRGFTGDDGRCPLPRHCETSPQAGRGNPLFLPHVRIPSRHPAVLSLHERPAQGRSFSIPAPENFPAPHCNICPSVV